MTPHQLLQHVKTTRARLHGTWGKRLAY